MRRERRQNGEGGGGLERTRETERAKRTDTKSGGSRVSGDRTEGAERVERADGSGSKLGDKESRKELCGEGRRFNRYEVVNGQVVI